MKSRFVLTTMCAATVGLVVTVGGCASSPEPVQPQVLTPSVQPLTGQMDQRARELYGTQHPFVQHSRDAYKKFYRTARTEVLATKSDLQKLQDEKKIFDESKAKVAQERPPAGCINHWALDSIGTWQSYDATGVTVRDFPFIIESPTGTCQTADSLEEVPVSQREEVLAGIQRAIDHYVDPAP